MPIHRAEISSGLVLSGKVLPAPRRLVNRELVHLDREEWIQRNEHAHLVSRGLLASGCQSKVAGDFRDSGIAEYRRRGMCADAEDLSVSNQNVV